MKRVLIVGKSKSAAAQLKRTLISLNYDVAGEAATGAEALLKVELLTPDVVLMDAAIPGEIDGIDAARLIQQNQGVPVLLIVDHSDEQSTSLVKQAKLNEYFVKPVRKEELKAGIENALKRWETKKDVPKLYEELVENTYDLIHVQDGNGNITFINNAVTETLGYAYKEIVGKNVKDFVTHETYLLLTDKFKRQLGGEDLTTLELQIYDKKGNVKTFETRERLVWDGDRIVEIQGISRDITERKLIEKELVLLNRLKEQLLGSYGTYDKLKLITDNVVEIFHADFARIWIMNPGDLCDRGCYHAGASEGRHTCRDRNHCLHLVASSGRYTHIDGEIHRRVPLGAYKIGQIALGQNPKFLTNDVVHDPHVHDHSWAGKLGLVSFAGYRLLSKEGEPIGVLALFSKQPISLHEDTLLEDLANSTAQVVQSAQVERILRKSEERYRALFENATFGIYHSLPDGRLLRLNRALASMLGYDSPEETLSSVRHVGQDIYAEPVSWTEHLAEVMQKTDWGVFEEHFRRKDGGIVDVTMHVRTVYGPGSTLEYLEGFVEDITEKRQAEEAIRRDRELKEKILQTAAVAIACAEHRKLTWANAAFEQTFGFTDARDYVGESTAILYASDEEFQRVGKLLYKGLGSEGVVETVVKFKRKDSEEFLGLMRISFVYPDDPIREVVVSFVDITEKTKAEEAIRRDRELKEKILQTATVGIAFAENRKITWANAAMERTFGFSGAAEYVGKDTSILYASEEEYQRIGKLAYEGIKSGEIVEAVARFRRADSTEFLGLVRVSFVYPADPLREIVVSISDITERTKAEEALRESEQRYRLLAENADDIIFTMDSDLTFTYISPSVTRIRGFTVEEAMAQTVAEALTPDSMKVMMSYFEQGIAAEAGGTDDRVDTQRLELEETCKDGSTIWTETMVSVLRNENDAFTGLLGITRDISKRKQFETALAESEEKYRMVVENAYEGIAVIQGNVFVFANRRLLDIFGYTDQEFLGRNYNDFLVPDDQNEADAEYYRKIAGGGYSYLSLLRIITKAGEIRWTEVSGVQIPWEGEPALIIFVRDVTERKKIEQAMIQSEAKYRDLIENAIDLIFTVDTEGNFLEVNESLLRDTGYSKQDIVSMGFRDFVHPEDAGIALDAYEKGKQGIPHEFEMRGKKKAGTYGWYSFVIRPIFDINGTVEYVHCIARNITDRKTAEEALVDSERKFRGVFEMSRDFMFISSLAGEILEYNPQAKDFFGYTDEEVRRTNIIDIYANPDERDAVLGKLIEEGFVENYEISLKKKDGSIIEALVTATVRRDRQGNVTGFQGSARDITKMKRMERQLLQAEKLSGLGTMISGVAHEINNPLTAIMGNAELMLMNDPADSNDRKSLEVILHESERAAKIVGGLLTFAREHTPERRMISVNDVIMEAQRLREYSLRVSNIRTELFLSDDMPLTFADPYQLQQVFSNIINNARDALMEVGGGTLTIRTIRSDAKLLIEFEDDGPGIANENIQKIFDPFYTTKDIGKGTGLGLSIAYGIVEEHNGKIEIESRQGKGAKFTVELPIVDRAEPAMTRAPEEPKVITGGKSILLVDDERDVLEFLSRALAQYGYAIQTASTAEDALVLMSTQTFDAVVADIKMPGMGGREMYAYVRKNIPGAAEKILFITGDILGDETQAFIADTGNICIKKPFKIGEFVAKLNELIIP